MDILDYLLEDHKLLRLTLDQLDSNIDSSKDEQGFPSGWKLRSLDELTGVLRLLLPALAAHEELEEKVLFAELKAAGVADTLAFDTLGSDHKELETLVKNLASALSGERGRPTPWLVATTLRLSTALRSHMAREEYQVFPMVRSTFTRRQLDALGRRAESVLHIHPSP